MIKNANTDLIAGIVGLVITAMFWYTFDPEMTRLSKMFPKAMMQIMGLISAALVIKGLFRSERGDLFADGNNRRVIVTAAHFFVWALAISRVGFFVTSVVVISSLVYYLALATRVVTLRLMCGWVLIVLAEVTLFYLIFLKLLHVPLPEGWLL